jgi:hypothetical protein
MKKAHNFTVAELFYIAEKSKAGESVGDIAKALGVTASLVKPHLLEPQPTVNETKRTETLTSQAFGRHKDRPGVVVSTPTASQHGDIKPTPPSIYDQKAGCIARTKE